jgi:hypothetical protein
MADRENLLIAGQGLEISAIIRTRGGSIADLHALVQIFAKPFYIRTG